MRKYIIAALLPIVFQGFSDCQASEGEFHRAIESSLQNARLLLENPMIPAALEPVLNALVAYVENGKINKNVALVKIHAIKNDIILYKNRQYTSDWQWAFGSTPQIVQNTVQPALDKVESTLSYLNGNSSSMTAWLLGGAVVAAATAGVITGGIQLNKYLKRKRAEREYREATFDEKFEPHHRDDESVEGILLKKHEVKPARGMFGWLAGSPQEPKRAVKRVTAAEMLTLRGGEADSEAIAARNEASAKNAALAHKVALANAKSLYLDPAAEHLAFRADADRETEEAVVDDYDRDADAFEYVGNTSYARTKQGFEVAREGYTQTPHRKVKIKDGKDGRRTRIKVIGEVPRDYITQNGTRGVKDIPYEPVRSYEEEKDKKAVDFGDVDEEDTDDAELTLSSDQAQSQLELPASSAQVAAAAAVPAGQVPAVPRVPASETKRERTVHFAAQTGPFDQASFDAFGLTVSGPLSVGSAMQVAPASTADTPAEDDDDAQPDELPSYTMVRRKPNLKSGRAEKKSGDTGLTLSSDQVASAAAVSAGQVSAVSRVPVSKLKHKRTVHRYSEAPVKRVLDKKAEEEERLRQADAARMAQVD